MKFGIGQSPSRLEDRRFLTGTGSYVDDIRLPGTAIGHAVRSPVAHATLVSVDVAAARAAPGVLAVYTGADVADMGPITFRLQMKQSDGSDFATVNMPRLAQDKVRFVGQPVVFIVAETLAAARDAGELVEMEFDDLPVAVTPEAALAPGAPLLHDTAPGNLAYDWDMGDAAAVEAAFSGAAHRVSVEVVNQRIVVNPMEPRGILVRYLPESESWEAWTGNQGAHSARDNLARGLGVDPARVRCRTPDVGGGFGMKLMDHPEYPLTARAARDLGRPVKWVGDRSESFLSDAQGRDLTTLAEGAFDAEGRVLALRFSSVSNLGAYYSSSGPGVHTSFSAPLIGGMYDVPAVHHRVRGVLTNVTPCDAYRGAGRPEVIHVTEQVIEAAAREIGLDGAEIRRRNLIRTEQIPYQTRGGFNFDSADTLANLDRTLEAIDYAGFPARQAESAARGKLRGIAVSYYFERTGGAPLENATIALRTDGLVDAAVGTQSTGQGHETAWAQIVRDKLGLPLESIRLAQGDTDTLPVGGGTGGSRSLIMASRVFLKAADEVIARATERASDRLEVAAGDIVFEPEAGGVFRIAGTDRSVTLLELAAEEPILGTGRVDDSVSSFPNGCHAAEVEVDPETGAVAYLRHVVTDDFGRIVNPALAAGQVHGGIVQGAGQVLGEAAVWDPETGQPLAGSFMDYVMPRAADFPEFETSFNEVLCRTNPLGVKGCGEAGSVGALPALSLAVQNALAPAGATLLKPPYTPCNIWRALHGAED